MSRRSTRSNLAATEIMGVPSMPTHVMPSIATMSASSSFHLQNYYNHPANTKLLLGNVSHGGGKGHHFVGGALPKPPKPPEKPLIPYMRYSRKVWDEVKTNNPELKLWEIGKIVGQQWRELPTVDKQQYIDEYEAEKIDHQEQLKQYHNSPAYQAYLHARSRAEAMEAAEALADKDDAYMSIEPTDDGADDSDLSCSVKHVAAARFQRNHRLINDILGETTPVPSNRSIVTTSRLGILKNQVQSLELHRKKLENELVHLEDTFKEKKRKMIAQSDNFEREMKRLKAITPQEYYQEHKLKQQQAAPPAQEKQTDDKHKKDETASDVNTVNDKSQENNHKDSTPQAKSCNTEEKSEDVKGTEKEPNVHNKGNDDQKMDTQENPVVTDQSEITKPDADADAGEESQDKDTQAADDSGDGDAKSDSKDPGSSSNADDDATASSNDTKDGDEGK